MVRPCHSALGPVRSMVLVRLVIWSDRPLRPLRPCTVRAVRPTISDPPTPPTILRPSDHCMSGYCCDMSVTPNHTTTSRDGPTCSRIQHLVHHLLKHWTLTTQLCRRKGGNVTKWSGAESSNANFSFPEHFEGKRQSGEMYQKDCLPLLSTFCKFQRLKVKGSRDMLVLCASIRMEWHRHKCQCTMMCRLS